MSMKKNQVQKKYKNDVFELNRLVVVCDHVNPLKISQK